MTSRSVGLLNRGLLMLMAGHFTVDLYSGLLPVLYPLLRERLTLDLAAIGLIATVFTTALSVSQPVFGLLVDRFGSRWLGPVAVVWMGAFIALIGFVGSYPAILAAAVLAGLGSGAYHPLGASNVPLVVPKARLNTGFSLFTVGGTSGFALGPIIGGVLFGVFGVRGPALLLPLSLAVAVWLAFGLGNLDQQKRAPQMITATAPLRRLQLRPLLAVLGIVMLRSWTFMVLLNFLPILYRSLGYGERFYSPLLFVIILSGSFGTIVGGSVADRFSRKAAIIGSLVLLGPAIWLLLAFPGVGSFLIGVLVGFTADFSLPATLTVAQGLMPGRVGVTTGLILGIGFVTAGIGMSITAAIADRVGLLQALSALPLLLVIALVLAWFVPGEQHLAREDHHDHHAPVAVASEAN